MMTEVIEYPNLNRDDLTARFDRDGSVSVRLTEQHAGACADLIDTCVAAYSLKGVGFVRRMWMLSLGLWVTGRVTLFHSRLMELTPLLILRRPLYRATQESDGKVFHFERRSV
jgi:hypothetical protein